MKKLSTKRIIMGVGSLVMAVVLVLVGTLKSAETLQAQEGMFRRVETLRDNQGENEYFTILEIIPDDGETELSYLVGEQEPYADGDFTTDDFLKLSLDEQRTYVEELEKRRILTTDETSKDTYPLFYHNASLDDSIFRTEKDASLVEEGYTETEGNFLVPGTFTEIVDKETGEVSYSFEADKEFEGKDIERNSDYAYFVNIVGEKVYLVYDAKTGNYVVTDPTQGSGDGEDTTQEPATGDTGNAEVVEGTAVVANASLPISDGGVIKPIDVSQNEPIEGPSEETTVGQPEKIVTPIMEPIEDNSPTPIVQPSIPEQPGDGEQPLEAIGDVSGNAMIKVAGDTYEGYGFMAGFLYEKQTEEYTVANNELMKKHVFNMELDDRENFKIDIKTVKVSELTTNDINSADMFYIQDGKYGVDGVSKDMSVTHSYMLISKIASSASRIPCIIDYKIYEELGTEAPNSFVYKLALMMMSTNMVDTFDYFTGNAKGWEADTSSEEWEYVKSFLPKTVMNGGHYVNDNVYFVNGIDLVSPDFTVTFSNQVITEAFADVYNAIVFENNLDPDREAMIADLINPAIVIQYLINYQADAGVLYKSSIRVLELQPCKDFNWDTDTGKLSFIDKYAPQFINNPSAVEIICMTTSEFVGKNDNLNTTYDMIYIGSNVGAFQQEVVTVTNTGNERTLRRWYDSDMKGMVYSHVGDQMNGTTSWWGGAGLLDSHYSNGGVRQDIHLRYPGNDITSHNMEDLLEYLKSDYPVVVADDFFTYDDTKYLVEGSRVTGINGGNSFKVNGKKKKITTTAYTELDNNDTSKTRWGILDTSTYLYQLVKAAWNPDSQEWANRTYQNFVNESNATQEFMEVYLNKQKLSLNLTKVPTRYSYTTQGKYEVLKDIRYLEKESDGKYYLTYEFSINNLEEISNGSERYTCKLFIDDNFDGKFSKTQEEVSELVVVESATGNTVSINNLQANKAYTVTRQLPGDYVGCVQWELLVSQNSNQYIQCNETGLTAVKSAKETINVLQVMSKRLDTTGGVTISLQEEIRKYVKANQNSAWGEALTNVPDFDINVQSINTEDLVNYYITWQNQNWNEASTNPENFFNESVNIFDGQGTDMLLMGFTDTYNEISHAATVKAIMNFANSGRSVLFSHDMTSYRMDYKNYAYYTDWSADSIYLGVHIREASGMDMYGATVNRYNQSSPANNGQGYSQGSDGWKYLVSLGKDMAFKPNTNQTQTIGETTGVTYIELRDQARYQDYFPYILSQETLQSWDGTPVDSIGGSWNGIYNNADDKTLITQVNDGVITSYPYEIPESFTSAVTHSQYYAVDLEADDDLDGESDLVVWYCVGARKSDADYNSKYIDLYNVSPNDVRNNYYIYNKGNVIYTGMGHALVGDAQIDEIKLFINTMVAAYRAGVKTPDVSIVESGDEGANRVDYIGIPYDLDNTSYISYDGTNTQAAKVYFDVTDNNIIKGAKKIVSEFYMNFEDVETQLTDLKVYDSQTNTEVASNALESGKNYYVIVPLTDAQISKSCEITVKVYSQVVKTNATVTSEKSSDSVIVSKIELFDLD